MKTKLTLFVAVIAFFFQWSLIGADLKKGLEAYYPFNGNARDESGNGHHGKTISRNGAKVVLTVDRNGVDDRAYRLDGPVSGFDIGEFNFQPISKITVSSWVKLAERNLRNREKEIEDAEYGILLGGGERGDDFHFMIWQNRVQIGARLKGGSDGFGHHKNLIKALPLNQWLHVVLTSDGNQISYFIDGVAVGNYQGIPDNLSVKGRFYIGVGTPKGNFNGDIDDVRIYNRGLSAKEVKALYDLEKPKGK